MALAVALSVRIAAEPFTRDAAGSQPDRRAMAGQPVQG